MKKFLRDIFIATVSYTGLSAIYRKRVRKNGPLVRVLVFHDVQNAKWFRESIEFVAEKYHVVSPEDFRLQRFDAAKINVLITFDDGYASWVETCLPVLEDENVHALFFINSGLIDVYGSDEKQEHYVRERLMLSPRVTLSWEGVKRLSDTGHTIGGHTVSHSRLAIFHGDMQKKEIQEDKARIETVLGKSVTMFAYPFGQSGDYTNDTMNILDAAGYMHAFTTEGVFAEPRNRFAISRLCIEDAQSTSSIGQWIEGGYDIYHKLKSLCVR